MCGSVSWPTPSSHLNPGFKQHWPQAAGCNGAHTAATSGMLSTARATTATPTDPITTTAATSTMLEDSRSIAGGDGGRGGMVPDGMMWAHPGEKLPTYGDACFLVLRRFPFVPDVPYTTVVVVCPDGSLMLYIKGAPESVAALCDPASVPEDFPQHHAAACGPGLVVMGTACKPLTLAPTSWHGSAGGCWRQGHSSWVWSHLATRCGQRRPRLWRRCGARGCGP